MARNHTPLAIALALTLLLAPPTLAQQNNTTPPGDEDTRNETQTGQRLTEDQPPGDTTPQRNEPIDDSRIPDDQPEPAQQNYDAQNSEQLDEALAALFLAGILVVAWVIVKRRGE